MSEFVLRLFVAGPTARSARAIDIVQQACNEELKDRCELEIVDVLADPDAAEEAQILTTPTLLKVSPAPPRGMIGDFASKSGILRALDLPANPGGG
jgi:circadian clock protein KaiB